ncbi:MAG TPA: hypothetical protein VHC92_06925 [Rhodanobacteraceae bacterium]|nr:hypothetical protein [Rhodanobacteraceae bacterium]
MKPTKNFMTSALFKAIAAALGAVAATTGASATSPIPDLAYGGHGDGIARVTLAAVPADSGLAKHAIVQPDGRLVLIGSTTAASTLAQVVLARLDAQGGLDTSFGPEHDGFYRTAFAGNADDIRATIDGAFVYTAHGPSAASVLVGRVHADGTPDTDFAGTGQLQLAPESIGPGTQADIPTLLPRPDGTLLALGWVGGGTTYQNCVMRLLADGSFDVTFGMFGRACFAPEFSAGAFSMTFDGLVLADGRIRVAGFSKHNGGSNRDMSVAALRATSDAVLDTSFGPDHDGWAFVGFDTGSGNNDEAHAIAIDPIGRIVLAGSAGGPNDNDDIAVARLLPDGEPDLAFGSQGRVEIALDLGFSNFDNAHSVAVLPDGHILVGGVAYTSDVRVVGVAILLESDGTLDAHFGTGGIYVQAPPPSAQTEIVQSAQQIVSGEFIYMVGTALNASGQLDFAVTRAVMPLFADGFDTPAPLVQR